MELISVTKSYHEKVVLHVLTARIPAGSVCAVLGASGCGKTTLLRLILGLEKPDSGRLEGIPVEKSALFQENRLCPGLTLGANLKMAVPHANSKEIDTLVQILGLQACTDKPIREFSGGMARRAALLRALCCPGELLVLDEPFTGLDEDNCVAAAKAVEYARKGRTLIYTAHDAPSALLPKPDCIIDLSAGTVVSG